MQEVQPFVPCRSCLPAVCMPMATGSAPSAWHVTAAKRSTAVAAPPRSHRTILEILSQGCRYGRTSGIRALNCSSGFPKQFDGVSLL